MAFSDVLILQAVQELIDQHGSDRVITHEMIETHTGISRATIERSLKRLLLTGRLIGECPNRRNGYRYRLPDEQQSHSGR